MNMIVGTGQATYTVIIEDENGCAVSSSMTVDNMCDDKKGKSATSMSMYPNPVRDMLNVKIDGAFKTDVTVEVYNLVGTKMFAKTYKPGSKKGAIDMKIDFSRFPSHVYYIKVITENGTTIKKVVLDK